MFQLQTCMLTHTHTHTHEQHTSVFFANNTNNPPQLHQATEHPRHWIVCPKATCNICVAANPCHSKCTCLWHVVQARVGVLQVPNLPQPPDAPWQLAVLAGSLLGAKLHRRDACTAHRLVALEAPLHNHGWADVRRESKVHLGQGEQAAAAALQVLLHVVCGELVQLPVKAPDVWLQQQQAEPAGQGARL